MNIENLCMGCMENKGEAKVCPVCGLEEGTPPESLAQLPARTVLHEHYLLGKVLGQGGFGITYLAWDMELDRKVAIKEYFPAIIVSRSFGSTNVTVTSGKYKDDFNYGLERFLEEGKNLAKFQGHPGIVSVVTFFKANGTAYLVMEYVEGMTFKAYLEQEGGKISFEIALKVLIPVMDALREIHGIGLLHRDISPENIYISEKGQVKLLDFGAARFAMGEHSKNLTVILKEGFAPVEQYQSKGNQGAWTDVYSMGATLYYAITGEKPPQSNDRLKKDELVTPRELGIDIPSAAESALLRALAVRAEDRYPRIKDFQEALNIEIIDPDRDDAAFNFAKKINTKEAFKIYLENHPGGKHAHEAKNILKKMDRKETENQEKEEEVFSMAKQLDTISAYKGFLEDFPDGKYADSARKRMRDLSIGVQKTIIAEKKPGGPGIISKLRSKTNIGALWMIGSIVLFFIAIFMIDAMGVSDNFRRILFICVILLSIVIGAWMISSRRTIMNGVEVACYWIGLSFDIVFLLGILFKLGVGDELIGITIGLVISLFSCAFLILKRRKKVLGLEIALYWIGLSCAFTGFLSILMQLVDYYHGAGRGAFSGAIISFISGFFIIIKQRKALSGKEIFVYWLGLTPSFGALMGVFFDSAEFSWLPEYAKVDLGVSLGLLISLLIGVFILIKKRKGAGWLEILFYWLGFSTVFSLLLALFFEASNLYWTGYGDSGSGIFFGLVISLISGIFIIIYQIAKGKKHKD